MEKKKLFHAHFILLLLFSSLFLLTSCGKQEESEQTAAEMRRLIVESEQETNFSLPWQVLYDGKNLWALSSDRTENIYRLQMESGFSQRIPWRKAEEVAICLALDTEDNVSLFTRDAGTISQRIITDQGEWETKATLDCGQELADQAQFLCEDTEGYLYLATTDTVYLYDPEGREVTAFEFSDRVVVLRVDEDGDVECITQSFSKLNLYHLENAADKPTLLWEKELSFGAKLLTVNEMIWVLLRDDMGLLCSIDKESSATLTEYSLENVAINSERIIGGWFDGENNGYFCEKRSDGGLTIYSLIEQEEGEETRTELVYGTTNLSDGIKKMIVEFNQSNPDYYITVRTYSDLEGGISFSQRLNVELITGNGPDIIDLSTQSNYAIYAKQGILEDLTPYLEGQGEDFLWSVYSPYTINDGIYILIPHFTVSMLFMDTQDDPGIEEWNMDTFFQLIETNGGEKDIFRSSSKKEFLLICLNGMQERFIDWNNGKADFDNEVFMKLLEFVNQYGPVNENYGSHSAEEVIKETLLYGSSPQYASNYLYNLRYYEEAEILGYPTEEGETFPIRICRDAMGITASSPNKEGAWQFLQMFLEENYQVGVITDTNNYIWGFPVYESLVEELFLETRNESYRGNGGKLEDLTDEEIEQYLEIIKDANHLSTADMLTPDIWNIINEESQSYFSGNMNVEMVMRNIQNRVQLLLDEQ